MLRKAIAVLAFFGAFFVVWMLMLMVLPGDLAWINSLVALAASLYVARNAWSGTAEGSTSVSVMAGLGAVIGAIVGPWCAKSR
jgi:hypothetical protein